MMSYQKVTKYNILGSHPLINISTPRVVVIFLVFFPACDQDYVSTTNIKSKNGTFKAPVFLNPEGHVRQCTYNFRALPGEILLT